MQKSGPLITSVADCGCRGSRPWSGSQSGFLPLRFGLSVAVSPQTCARVLESALHLSTLVPGSWPSLAHCTCLLVDWFVSPALHLQSSGLVRGRALCISLMPNMFSCCSMRCDGTVGYPLAGCLFVACVEPSDDDVFFRGLHNDGSLRSSTCA